MRVSSLIISLTMMHHAWVDDGVLELEDDDRERETGSGRHAYDGHSGRQGPACMRCERGEAWHMQPDEMLPSCSVLPAPAACIRWSRLLLELATRPPLLDRISAAWSSRDDDMYGRNGMSSRPVELQRQTGSPCSLRQKRYRLKSNEHAKLLSKDLLYL